MGFVEEFYPESRFGGFTNIDGTILFFLRVNALLEKHYTVLDVGCGRGEYADDPVSVRRTLRSLKGKVKAVIGLDVDPAGGANPTLDSFVLIDDPSHWSIANESIDLIVCDHVLEHIDAPESFFSEVARVLKPGGYFCARTPNKWGYVGMIARLVPNSLHARITSRTQSVRHAEDVFPTRYRCNTSRKIKALTASHAMVTEVIPHEAEPAYLSFSRIAFAAGVFHQRWSPRLLKPVLFVFSRKKGGTALS